MNLIAPKNRIIVEKLINTNETASGIYLAKSLEDDYGLVKSVGAQVHDSIDIAVGDKVLLVWAQAKKVKDEIYSVSVDFVVAVLVP